MSRPTPLHRRKIEGYFIGKPVPWNLVKYADKYGHAVAVIYIGLWVIYSATNRREIKIRRELFDGSKLSDSSITRGIDKLIRAGLVREVSRKPGQTPVVELLTNQSEVNTGYAA